jgi:hypothetical protein
MNKNVRRLPDNYKEMGIKESDTLPEVVRKIITYYDKKEADLQNMFGGKDRPIMLWLNPRFTSPTYKADKHKTNINHLKI